MKPQERLHWIAAAICVLLFASAFVAAPRSCDGGLEAYALVGLVSMLALFMVALAQRKDWALAMRIAMATGFSAIGLAVWFAGLFAANVRIMCRLF